MTTYMDGATLERYPKVEQQVATEQQVAIVQQAAVAKPKKKKMFVVNESGPVRFSRDINTATREGKVYKQLSEQIQEALERTKFTDVLFKQFSGDFDPDAIVSGDFKSDPRYMRLEEDYNKVKAQALGIDKREVANAPMKAQAAEARRKEVARKQSIQGQVEFDKGGIRPFLERQERLRPSVAYRKDAAGNIVKGVFWGTDANELSSPDDLTKLDDIGKYELKKWDPAARKWVSATQEEWLAGKRATIMETGRGIIEYDASNPAQADALRLAGQHKREAAKEGLSLDDWYAKRGWSVGERPIDKLGGQPRATAAPVAPVAGQQSGEASATQPAATSPAAAAITAGRAEAQIQQQDTGYSNAFNAPQNRSAGYTGNVSGYDMNDEEGRGTFLRRGMRRAEDTMAAQGLAAQRSVANRSIRREHNAYARQIQEQRWRTRYGG